MGWSGRLGFRLVGVTLVCASWADAEGKNPAAAQALYDDAQAAVAAGKFDEACPKFKESYDLDPGGGTLLNLADCYEKQGKTALAWTTFKEALVVARRDGRNERVDFATKHIAQLDQRLSRLTIAVAERPPGLEVTIDGTRLGEAAYGVAMPVDPGEHHVKAVAPGKQPFEKSIDVPKSAGEKLQIEIPALADATSDSAATASASEQSAPTTTASAGSSTRTLGFVAGGIGLASLAVGGFFGLQAYSRWDERNEACKGGCTDAAKADGDDARQAATVSTIGFGVGAAALGVGLVLILTSGSSEEKPSSAARIGRMQVGVLAEPGRAGLTLGSKW
jgi:tetratricopeptide (TPR) repeat protein